MIFRKIKNIEIHCEPSFSDVTVRFTHFIYFFISMIKMKIAEFNVAAQNHFYIPYENVQRTHYTAIPSNIKQLMLSIE